MEKIVGKYKHYKNENIDEYFTAVGVPFVARKMMTMSSPVMEIMWDGSKVTIRNSSALRTTEQTFALGEEYEEKMPDATIKSTATLQPDGSLTISSIIPGSGDKTVRHYEFKDGECVITMTHDKVKNPAKRYFKKIE